ncbi:MAG: hypothetical protein WBB07_07735 [Mycobacterium sp.]
MAAATETAAAAVSAAVRSHIADPDPVRALAGFVEMWEQMLDDSDYTACCLIVAATLGRAEAPADTVAPRRKATCCPRR